jgi:hypothetical protein
MWSDATTGLAQQLYEHCFTMHEGMAISGRNACAGGNPSKPLYQDVAAPSGPHTSSIKDGVNVAEQVRPSIRMEADFSRGAAAHVSPRR